MIGSWRPLVLSPAVNTDPWDHTGFGAAKHLSEQGYGVTLLEASPNPGGLATGWRTASGREVEAGMKGMWYEVSPSNGQGRRFAMARQAACNGKAGCLQWQGRLFALSLCTLCMVMDSVGQGMVLQEVAKVCQQLRARPQPA